MGAWDSMNTILQEVPPARLRETDIVAFLHDLLPS